MARRSLKPQLNQIRTWVRQGRTDAWIAHQLDVSARDISSFKKEHELVVGDATNGGEADVTATAADQHDEPDLRAEDDALVAAALEAEDSEEPADEPDEPSGDSGDDDDDEEQRKRRRRRGRRGGRSRKRPSKAGLEGTFDHGDEGYGLWLDPAVQDDAVYAEHWAGQRAITVSFEPDRIVITRTGEGGQAADDDSSGDDDGE